MTAKQEKANTFQWQDIWYTASKTLFASWYRGFLGHLPYKSSPGSTLLNLQIEAKRNTFNPFDLQTL